MMALSAQHCSGAEISTEVDGKIQWMKFFG